MRHLCQHAGISKSTRSISARRRNSHAWMTEPYGFAISCVDRSSFVGPKRRWVGQSGIQDWQRQAVEHDSPGEGQKELRISSIIRVV
jgi:hypothetical protein